MKQGTPIFAKETELCAAFMKCLPQGWTAYPETGGFDILLVRDDRFQIGVEAKLRLNAKVISQAAEPTSYYSTTSAGPDCRAVLVPSSGGTDLSSVCALLGLTVIGLRDENAAMLQYRTGPFQPRYRFYPDLPRMDVRGSWGEDGWYERCPSKRLRLPDYVPDVTPGDSAPVALTHWKIKAIKIAVTLEKRGFLTRADFKHHEISMPRWVQNSWIVGIGNGRWVKAAFLPNFRSQHPKNYVEIEADFEDWRLKDADQPGLFESAK